MFADNNERMHRIQCIHCVYYIYIYIQYIHIRFHPGSMAFPLAHCRGYEVAQRSKGIDRVFRTLEKDTLDQFQHFRGKVGMKREAIRDAARRGEGRFASIVTLW